MDEQKKMTPHSFREALQKVRESIKEDFAKMSPGYSQGVTRLSVRKKEGSGRWSDFCDRELLPTEPFERLAPNMIHLSLLHHLLYIKHDFVFHRMFYQASEMDMAAISNRLLYEFEIKCGRQDFTNDFSKTYKKGTYYLNKHATLAEGKGLSNFFYFVIPEGMLDVDHVPDHAGLIAAYKVDGSNFLSFKILKVAPLLHSNRLTDSTMLTLAKKAYGKYINILQKYADKIFYFDTPPENDNDDIPPADNPADKSDGQPD